MHKAIVLAAILLYGCATPVQRQYSDGNAVRVLDVMWQCAMIIKSMNLPTEPERDWHYQQCLHQNGATI